MKFSVLLAVAGVCSAYSGHKKTDYEGAFGRMHQSFRKLEAGVKSWTGEIKVIRGTWDSYFPVAHRVVGEFKRFEKLEEADFEYITPAFERAVGSAQRTLEAYKLKKSIVEKKKLCHEFHLKAKEHFEHEHQFSEAFFSKIPSRLHKKVVTVRERFDKVVTELVDVYSPKNCHDRGTAGYHG
ncbi:hypothetical protein CDD83_8571 [Cordyceps sp. RAO-2017]|nr:hypothetical protein CDD83_8571 [Cordyceps sp. RAO-2017]